MGRDFINCPMSHLVVEKSADVHRDVDHCIEVGGDRAVLELKTRLEGFKQSLEFIHSMQFYHRLNVWPLEVDVKVNRREIPAEGLGEALVVALNRLVRRRALETSHSQRGIAFAAKRQTKDNAKNRNCLKLHRN
jgi:hypothetical protein